MIDNTKLNLAYPKYEQNSHYYDSRITQAVEEFYRHFGKKPYRLFSAPGRTEIGGNHTDHQRGNVLAASIDLDILGVAAKNDTNTIRVLSQGYPLDVIKLDDLSVSQSEINSSASLIRGIAARLTQLGYKIEGFDAYTVSDVLKGSGLSSSAAYEVLCGVIMNGLFCNSEVSAEEIAQIGQYAENVYFGKPSGLMDQMASSVGNVVAIDFKDTEHPVVKRVEFDFSATGYALCIIDSGADHANLTEEYSAIPKEMGAVAKQLGVSYLGKSTKQKLFDNLAQIREQVGDRAILRAIHFYDDNQRAIEQAQRLSQNDFEGFLELVNQSGQSSYMYLQNVTVCGQSEQQHVAYALAVCQSLLAGRGAFRVHGGGFAGTIQAFVPMDILDDFKTNIEKLVGAGCCHVLSIRKAGGIELTQGEGI